jgi:Inner membrane component of T3SS, cytoplasmic domain
MIWVEVLSRNRVVLTRHHCAGREIRVGRSYDNDIIVDDPYVDPRHLRIMRNEAGLLVAEDLGSVNGLFSDQSPDRTERLVVDGNRLICIGRTYLRIREEGHAVAPARVASHQVRSWPLLVVLGVAALGGVALFQWLGETSEPKPSDYLMMLLLVCCVVLVWAGGWAMLSRVFSGHASFERNLLIALWGALAFALGEEVAGLAAFALSWIAVDTYSYVAAWAVLAVVCFLHLREMSASRLWLKAGATAALAVVAIGMQTLLQLEQRSDVALSFYTEQQGDLRRHLPPALRLAPLRSEKAFFTGAARLKAKLDDDRRN